MSVESGDAWVDVWVDPNLRDSESNRVQSDSASG